MQTFLPYPDFLKTARCLDYRRLGKQRVETIQILNTLYGYSNAWQGHPAVKMWKGYEHCLARYYNYIVKEWMDRGYKNTMPFAFSAPICIKLPPWLGNEKFHASHRSNLLRKNYDYYSKYGWNEPNDLPYVWPV